MSSSAWTPKRWSDTETRGLIEIRKILGDELLSVQQNAEVIGDRKLLRFFRGHNQDVTKACEMIRKFLNWRITNNVDAIREKIVYGGIDHPMKFPYGEKVFALMPQIIIHPTLCDKTGAPICVEQYNFSPSEVLKQITIEEYIEFVIYSLEYKSIILEQLSHQEEMKKLNYILDMKKNYPDDSNIPDDILKELNQPYGVIMHTCVIRDLGNVGLEHIGSQGQEIIKAVIGVASDNFPELMHKCHMINTPWVFNTVWWVIKGWLAPRTISKVNVLGSSFRDYINAEINMENIPALIGGPNASSPEPFVFDVSESGPLAPIRGQPESESKGDEVH